MKGLFIGNAWIPYVGFKVEKRRNWKKMEFSSLTKCAKSWRIKILRRWLQNKISRYDSMSRSWWTHAWAMIDQTKAWCILSSEELIMYISQGDYKRARRRSSDDQFDVKGVILRMSWECWENLWEQLVFHYCFICLCMICTILCIPNHLLLFNCCNLDYCCIVWC